MAQMKQNTKLKLIMTKGLPASGKSTWSKSQQAKDNMIVRTNKDELRSLLHNGVWSKTNEKQVVYMRNEIVCHSLSHGRTVIVDDTNFHPSHEETLREFAKFNKAKFEIKDFTDVPLEVCLKRDAARTNPVGRKNIIRMYNKYLRKQNEKPLNPVVYSDSLPYCVIFDLDGTLAHIYDRSPYDGKSCGSDLVNESVKFLFDLQLDPIKQTKYNHVWVDKVRDQRYGEGFRKIILSGRNGESQPETEKWLLDNGIHYDELHMRKPGDTRKDSVIKRELFEEHIKDKYNVLFIVDDRDQVVDLWRSMGITCLQCNYGTF